MQCNILEGDLPRGPAGPYSQINRRANRDRVRSGMLEFESSHSSQAVWQLEIVPSKIREMPANGGFSQFLTPSLVVKLGQSQSEIVDSLRLILEIFPFSGELRLEIKFDLHCVRTPHCLDPESAEPLF